MKRQCVGIDIANEDFKASLAKTGADGRLSCTPSKKFDNTRTGFNQLTRWVAGEMDKDISVVFLMEATGVYYEELAHHLHRIGKQVRVVLPNKFKHYTASLNMKSKTDAIDAKLLARFGVEREHQPWSPADPIFRQMRHLSRYRIQLQEQKTAISNILHSKDHSHEVPADITRSSKKIIAVLEREIDKLEQQMEKLVKSDEQVHAKIEDLCSIPGCKLITAAAIVAETGGFKEFTSAKQLTSYAGYDIVHNESGTSVKGKTHISKKGNRFIRHHLFLPAMCASTHVPEFNALRERIKDRTKIPMKAQVAVQRKLLILMYTLWKTGSAYEKDHYQKKIARDQARATQDSALEQLPLEV
ncbi:MAG: IS110 family transposase [Bacteroidota bacterium]|nr:IS110 family transposase [Bacteroidota bacterium]